AAEGHGPRQEDSPDSLRPPHAARPAEPVPLRRYPILALSGEGENSFSGRNPRKKSGRGGVARTGQIEVIGGDPAGHDGGNGGTSCIVLAMSGEKALRTG